MADEINRCKVGNVRITRVVEMEGVFPPGAMFNRLKKASYTPESIDTVLCTRLHLDHCEVRTLLPPR